jgi:hypothetical protein
MFPDFLMRTIFRLEATDHPGLRYAICAIASELCKSDFGLVRLRDINFAQAVSSATACEPTCMHETFT